MSRIRSNMFNRRTRDREPGTHTHNYNLGLNHGGNYASGEGASIGQHTHRIVASSIPPHSHPIYPNEHGHYSKVMSVEDVWEAELNFIYPPREHKKTLQDGFIANAAFEKENVEKKLKDKVRRSNNLIVEIQGAVIVTSK